MLQARREVFSSLLQRPNTDLAMIGGQIGGGLQTRAVVRSTCSASSSMLVGSAGDRVSMMLNPPCLIDVVRFNRKGSPQFRTEKGVPVRRVQISPSMT